MCVGGRDGSVRLALLHRQSVKPATQVGSGEGRGGRTGAEKRLMGKGKGAAGAAAQANGESSHTDGRWGKARGEEGHYPADC